MALVLPPVTDEGQWGYRGSISYSPDGTNRTGMKVFPPSLTSPLLRVKTVAEAVPGKWKSPPEHWFLAGNLNLVHGENWRDARQWKVPLNYDSLYWLDPIAFPYRVGFDAVDWLPVLEVKIYEWTGSLEEDPDLAEIQAQVELLGDAIGVLSQGLIDQNSALASLSQQVGAIGTGTGTPSTTNTSAIALLPNLQQATIDSLDASTNTLTPLIGGTFI